MWNLMIRSLESSQMEANDKKWLSPSQIEIDWSVIVHYAFISTILPSELTVLR